MEKSKIINTAGVEIELCDGKHTIESNTVEAEAVNIKVEKEQSCDKVLVGEKLKYTVLIINECGTEVHDLLFRDTFDECTIFVKGSFTVNGKPETPDVYGNKLAFRIEKLESCETITITFEVEVTEDCCKCKHPEPEKSREPFTRTAISRFERVIVGTGIRGATVFATFPGGAVGSSVVGSFGTWSISVIGSLSAGDIITVVQTEAGKDPSSPVFITVF